MIRFGLLMLVLLGSLLTACDITSSGELIVYEPWIRPASAGQNGAVYFVIDNQTQEDDSLIGVRVSSRIAEAAEMHLSWITENDFVQMRLQEAIFLQSDTQVVFSPGGLHIMLVSLQQDLAYGDKIELSLLFAKGGEIVIIAPVVDPTID